MRGNVVFTILQICDIIILSIFEMWKYVDLKNKQIALNIHNDFFPIGRQLLSSCNKHSVDHQWGSREANNVLCPSKTPLPVQTILSAKHLRQIVIRWVSNCILQSFSFRQSFLIFWLCTSFLVSVFDLLSLIKPYTAIFKCKITWKINWKKFQWVF